MRRPVRVCIAMRASDGCVHVHGKDGVKAAHQGLSSEQTETTKAGGWSEKNGMCVTMSLLRYMSSSVRSGGESSLSTCEARGREGGA